MSDIEESGTTVVDVEKPVKQKKPRTEAQKKATAKALEALAEHRAKKWAEKEEALAKPPKGKTTPKPLATPPIPIPSPTEPTPPPPAPASYDDDIKALRAELQALKKAPKGKAPKVKAPTRNRVKESRDLEDYDYTESEEEEEVVVVRKPKKVVKRVVRKVYDDEEDEEKHPYMNNDVLQSIFFRNM